MAACDQVPATASESRLSERPARELRAPPRDVIAMIRINCPTCHKPIEVAAVRDLPSFPFCSERCRLIDLGRWLDERHGVPAEAPSPAERTEPPSDSEVP